MCYLCGKEFINISFTSCISSSNFSLWKGLWWWRWHILERHQATKNGPGLGLYPTPCVLAEAWFAFRLHLWLVKLDLLVVLTNLAKAPHEGWQWMRKHCKGQGWEGRAWGNYLGLHGMHLPIMENNTLRKASKEVRFLLVTSENPCTSLLRNVCLPSTQHFALSI